MPIESGCLGCADRHVGCHDACPKYAEFKRKLALEKRAETEAKKKDEYGKSLIKKTPRR